MSRPITIASFRWRNSASNRPLTIRWQLSCLPVGPSRLSRLTGSLQYGLSMNFHTGLKRNQPPMIPAVIAIIDLITRVRSSRMCSMSGILASGLAALRVLGRRGLLPAAPDPPAPLPAPGAGLSCACDITGLRSVRLTLGPRLAGRRGVSLGLLALQIAQLPLQVIDLLLLCVTRRLGRDLRWRRRHERG